MCLSRNVLRLRSLNDLLDLRGASLEPILVCYMEEQTEVGMRHFLHVTSPKHRGFLLWLAFHATSMRSGRAHNLTTEAFCKAPGIVRNELSKLGYHVSTGVYGIDESIPPLNGVIDCLNFTANKHGHISAVALEPKWRIFPEEIF